LILFERQRQIALIYLGGGGFTHPPDITMMLEISVVDKKEELKANLV